MRRENRTLLAFIENFGILLAICCISGDIAALGVFISIILPDQDRVPAALLWGLSEKGKHPQNSVTLSAPPFHVQYMQSYHLESDLMAYKRHVVNPPDSQWLYSRLAGEICQTPSAMNCQPCIRPAVRDKIPFTVKENIQ